VCNNIQQMLKLNAMPTLIDGHNLIPKLGLSLHSLDDEMQLVSRLQVFCRAERRQVEVYFDGAPAGQVGTRRLGLVTAHFVRLGSTADSAIRARLKTLGRAARNWIVVTSDRQVQADARAAGPGSAREAGMSDAEVEEWLHLFRENKR
jgi:predicted RNA-binding protein with PIN domain